MGSSLAWAAKWRGYLLVGKDRLEAAYEIGGADDVLAEFAEHFDGAGVDHGDVHDGVARAVLHGDGRVAFEHGGKFALELLPRGVLALCAGKCVEPSALDAVYEFARLAIGGNDVVPATRDVSIFRQTKDARCQRIAIVMIVEEPGVHARVTQCGLDPIEIHCSIVSPMEPARRRVVCG